MTDQENPLQRIIAKCWADESFKARLLADPAGVLADEGMPLPGGVTVRVVADSATERTLVIPAPPGKLRDEELDSAGVSAGDCSAWNSEW